MATQTTLSDEEQAEIFRAQSFKLATELATGWAKSAGDLAPVVIISAIEGMTISLVPLIGVEQVIELLEGMAKGMRSGVDENRDAS